ncbi:MurR/RpiR family transcriptional regulator [Aerococcaceae bacterium NML210727]|nr:MurR/RpiR family transcriptional regulator [Aerococcaceae bacterium NML210727]MCW6655308.1 MurR/RpiR family transcriptional regulator [Aerococcaceae bacterium NML201296]MCW6662211.1 MurR/RpiR family transcriptional regulator [Aerococcaceae bacterium NML201209]MCW6667605.1 MurR/RpiR family transcriptional regulator [Aerococcaceae bacterium NML190938]
MSCIYKIKKSLPDCTPVETQLAEYILNNRSAVIHYSAQLLAKKSNTSAATVVRYAKKLGYKGFQQLKIDLAKDNSEQEVSFDDIILEEDDTLTLVKKSYSSNLKTLEQTYNLINVEHLSSAIHLLTQAETIYLVGVGGSSIICEDLMHKLTRINKKVIFHQNFHIFLHNLTYIKPKDVLIAVSYSGETPEIINAVKFANAAHAPVVAITQFRKNTLAKLADILLNTASEEKEMRLGAISSRFSSLILSDLLYLGLAKQNIDDTTAKILETRQIIKKLQ